MCECREEAAPKDMDEDDYRRVEREREVSGKRRKGSKAGEQVKQPAKGGPRQAARKLSKHTSKAKLGEKPAL